MSDGPARSWRPPPLIANPYLRYGLMIAAAIYLVLAVGTIEVNWARLVDG